MNIYGLLMSIGWLCCCQGLKSLQTESNVCSIDIDYISFFWLIITIIGSKLFQKIFRNTWEGNASHGALFGSFFYLCLISNYCDSFKIVNYLSYYFPALYFLIRMGNYYNSEHYTNSRSSNYIQLYEGILQGPVTYLLLKLINPDVPVILFIILTSIIRIYFEFLRDSFDIKNIIISIVTMMVFSQAKYILHLNMALYLLFTLDIICKLFIDDSIKSKNYGFNFSLLSSPRLKHYNIYIHICIFPLVLYYKNLAVILGSVSNLLDRSINGYVTDYINIPVYPFSKYRFNIADILITLGLLCIPYNTYSI